jgi:DnaJ-class molecular chaperone
MDEIKKREMLIKYKEDSIKRFKDKITYNEENVKVSNDCIKILGAEIEDIKLEIKSISTSQSEGTELKFKVPSANATDKPCPQCKGQGYYENPDMIRNKDIEECGLCKGTGKARL